MRHFVGWIMLLVFIVVLYMGNARLDKAEKEALETKQELKEYIDRNYKSGQESRKMYIERLDSIQASVSAVLGGEQ